jgi:hypothetical protein
VRSQTTLYEAARRAVENKGAPGVMRHVAAPAAPPPAEVTAAS